MWASLVAPLVKNLPEMQETLVRFLGWADPLEKGYVIHSSLLGLPFCLSFPFASVKNPPAMQETWVGKIPWRRERLPTPVFWPWEFYGLHSPWGQKESHMIKQLSFTLSYKCNWITLLYTWNWHSTANQLYLNIK